MYYGTRTQTDTQNFFPPPLMSSRVPKSQRLFRVEGGRGGSLKHNQGVCVWRRGKSHSFQSALLFLLLLLLLLLFLLFLLLLLGDSSHLPLLSSLPSSFSVSRIEDAQGGGLHKGRSDGRYLEVLLTRSHREEDVWKSLERFPGSR